MTVVIVGSAVASARLGEPADVLGGPTQATDVQPAAVLGRGLRYKDRATQLAMLAAARALADAGLANGSHSLAGDEIGVVASSNLGNIDTVCRTAERISTGSVRELRPMDLPNASSNIVASSIAVRFGLRGPNVMVCNGTSSGLDAAYLASTLISTGRVPRVLVVGVEPANDVVRELLGEPAREPFDGAVAIVMEASAAAIARGARYQAGFGGYARRADPASSVARVIGEGPWPALWLASGRTEAPAAVCGADWADLEATLGPASGALGVLQLAAGAHWLASGGHGPVLATAGDADDGIASVLLTRAEAV